MSLWKIQNFRKDCQKIFNGKEFAIIGICNNIENWVGTNLVIYLGEYSTKLSSSLLKIQLFNEEYLHLGRT